MPLDVRRLPKARIDYLDAWLHIADDSLRAADAFADRLDEAATKLADYPELGPERPDLGPSLRILPVDSYVIFYRVGPHVEIVRILHSARNVTPDLLTD
jgi:toxin ParE1/3/4